MNIYAQLEKAVNDAPTPYTATNHDLVSRSREGLPQYRIGAKVEFQKELVLPNLARAGGDLAVRASGRIIQLDDELYPSARYAPDSGLSRVKAGPAPTQMLRWMVNWIGPISDNPKGPLMWHKTTLTRGLTDGNPLPDLVDLSSHTLVGTFPVERQTAPFNTHAEVLQALAEAEPSLAALKYYSNGYHPNPGQFAVRSAEFENMANWLIVGIQQPAPAPAVV